MSNAASSTLSIEASRAGGVPVQYAVHPGGAQGAKFSIEKMIEKIRVARKDWRLRKWAGRKLMAAGNPTGKFERVSILLDAFRKQTLYAYDPPNTEMVVSPAVTLCLDGAGDDGGDVCIPLRDCFPKGTVLLKDDYQLVLIEDVQEGDRIWGHDKWTTVKKKWPVGVKNVSTIILNNGSQVPLTEEHHVYAHVCDRHHETNPACDCKLEMRRIDRIKVSDLKPGMVLTRPKRIPFGSGDPDPDKTYVDGLFLSEGWIDSCSSSFSISGCDGFRKESIKHEVKSICDRMGIKTTWHRKSIRVLDRKWATDLSLRGIRARFKNAETIDLGEAAAAALLRGIMSDSTANTHGDGRTYSTTSTKLMIQTRVLHRMFGIGTGVRFMTPEQHGGAGEHPMWRMQVWATKTRAEKMLRIKEVERDTGEAVCFDITTDDGYVYLPQHDVTVSNCDDGVVCLVSVFHQAGIDGSNIIAHAYDDSGVPSHVLFGVAIDGQLVRGDPSTELPFGQSLPCSQEWIVDPYANDPLYMAGKGDYIGVGRSGGHMGRSGGQMGLGSYDLGAAVGLGDVAPDVHDAAVNQIQQATFALKKSVIDLRSSIDQLTNARNQIRPDEPYDPEPGWAVDLSNLPSGGVWTQSMGVLASAIFGWATPLLEAADDVLNGVRQIMLDTSNPGDAYIEAQPSDSFRLVRVVKSVQEDVVAITDSAGNVVGGFSSTGASLTVQNIKDKIAAAGKSIISGLGFSGPTTAQGMGLAPLVIVVIVALAAAAQIVASIAIYYAISKFCDMLTTKAQEATNQDLIKCLTTSGAGASNCKDLAQIIAQNRVDVKKAEADANKSDPFAQATSSIASAVTWVVVGGVIVSGIYLGAPLVKGLFEELKKKRETKAA